MRKLKSISLLALVLTPALGASEESFVERLRNLRRYIMRCPRYSPKLWIFPDGTLSRDRRKAYLSPPAIVEEFGPVFPTAVVTIAEVSRNLEPVDVTRDGRIIWKIERHKTDRAFYVGPVVFTTTFPEHSYIVNAPNGGYNLILYTKPRYFDELHDLLSRNSIKIAEQLHSGR